MDRLLPQMVGFVRGARDCIEGHDYEQQQRQDIAKLGSIDVLQSPVFVAHARQSP